MFEIILFWMLVFLGSLALLIKSSDIFTTNGEKIGLFFNMPRFIIGVTIVSVGTSLPELATSIIAAIQKETDISVGNIIGSNIFDYLGIFGIISLMKPIAMSGPLLDYLLLFALGSYGLLYVVMNDRKIQNVEGIALLALFAGFLIQLTNI